jgi:hypothetical protein
VESLPRLDLLDLIVLPSASVWFPAFSSFSLKTHLIVILKNELTATDYRALLLTILDAADQK